MRKHIHCICLAFPHCVFLIASSKNSSQNMLSHTDDICLIFLHSVLSNDSSKCLSWKLPSHTSCICVGSPHWMLSNVLLNRLVEKKHNYTGCNCLIFLHCVFDQMHPQIAWPREWEIECVKTSSVCLHVKLYSHTDYITRGQQFEDIFDKTQRRQPMWLNLDNQLENTIDNAQWSQTNENQGTLRQPFVGDIWIFTVEMKI